MSWTISCSEVGPVFQDEDVYVHCTLPRGHESRHIWWNDSGTVKVEWELGFHFGPADWREEWITSHTN